MSELERGGHTGGPSTIWVLCPGPVLQGASIPVSRPKAKASIRRPVWRPLFLSQARQCESTPLGEHINDPKMPAWGESVSELIVAWPQTSVAMLPHHECS